MYIDNVVYRRLGFPDGKQRDAVKVVTVCGTMQLVE
jgi:hypothetical protein